MQNDQAINQILTSIASAFNQQPDATDKDGCCMLKPSIHILKRIRHLLVSAETTLHNLNKATDNLNTIAKKLETENTKSSDTALVNENGGYSTPVLPTINADPHTQRSTDSPKTTEGQLALKRDEIDTYSALINNADLSNVKVVKRSNNVPKRKQSNIGPNPYKLG